MKRQARRNWWALMVLASIVASCRTPVPLCRGAECDAPLTSLAGAGPTEQVTAGEAGRASVEHPECSSDAECANDRVCDGAELCNDGSCEPGEPISCPHPALHCTEGESEPCVFDTPSPWLIVGRGETLEGLPTSELGPDVEWITLATRPPSRAMGFAGAIMGTSGPFALALGAEEEFLFSAQYFRFGRGLPSELQLLPDVPDLLDSIDAPLVSPDSRFALLFDRAHGIFLAPLADRRQPTLLFSRDWDDYFEPSFCDESGTFWRGDDSGLTIVTATPAGPQSRRIEASSPAAFSWEKRFIVVETDDPQSVIVTPCSIAGANTVYDGASSPVLGPGSETLLLSLDTGGQKLFSLADPQAQVELWSSSVSLLDPTFSTDGAHLVGSVDETLYVADLNASHPPMSLGLPHNASFAKSYPFAAGAWQALVGQRAALVWVPTADEEGRELFWQPLDPSRQRQSLLVDPDSSSVDTLLSQHDVDQVFVVVEDAGVRHLKRIRLDTEEPELEPLFPFEGDISTVEVAPDGSGLLVRALNGIILSNLYWSSIDADGKVQPPFHVRASVFSFAFQPWP